MPPLGLRGLPWKGGKAHAEGLEFSRAPHYNVFLTDEGVESLLLTLRAETEASTTLIEDTETETTETQRDRHPTSC